MTSSLIKVTYADGREEMRTPESFLMTDGICNRCKKEVYYDNGVLYLEDSGKRHWCKRKKDQPEQVEDDDESL